MNRDLELASNLARRIGDQERDECVETLNAHHALGRLSPAELDRRQDLAMVSVTHYDLLSLISDLPALSPAGPTSPWSASGGSARVRKIVDEVSTTAICAVPVLGSAWFFSYSLNYDNLGTFFGTVWGGVVGYGARVIISKRMDSKRTRSDKNGS